MHEAIVQLSRNLKAFLEPIISDPARNEPKSTRAFPCLMAIVREMQRVMVNPSVQRLADDIAQALVFHEILDATPYMVNETTLLGKAINEIKQSGLLKQLNGEITVNLKSGITCRPYEEFLKVHDPSRRRHRGVFYTPHEIVHFMIEALQWILQQDLEMVDGLCNEDVRFFDPAAGTGIFLVEAFLKVLEKTKDENSAKHHLLEHFSGNEILLPAVLLARERISRLMVTHGINLGRKDKIPVHHSNSLSNLPADLDGERGKNTTLLIAANPPYSVSSSNKQPSIEQLMNDYKKHLNERNIQPLSDDYIKFFRMAHHLIQRNGKGVIAFVTNNAWLYKVIHRRMRESILETFNKIYIINLHGNANIGERAPDGSPDGNVFGIRVGVSIVFLVKAAGLKTSIYYHDLQGTVASKLSFLASKGMEEVPFKKLEVKRPYFFMVPMNLDYWEKYREFPGLDEIFKESIIGVKTHRDGFIVDFSRENVRKKIREFLDPSFSTQYLKEKYRINGNMEKIQEAREKLQDEGFQEERIIHYAYRVHDDRFTYYHPSVITRDRRGVMKHMKQDNLALISTRLLSSKKFTHVFASTCIGDIGFLSSRTSESAYFFPLKLTRETSNREQRVESNLSSGFIRMLEEKVSLTLRSPRDAFSYIYAILHSEEYRERYAEFLRFNFPRIPVVDNARDFWKLVSIGEQLIQYHAGNGEDTMHPSRLTLEGDGTVKKISYSRQKQAIQLNETGCIFPVSPNAWRARIGSYNVLKKWLKGRKGKILDKSDLCTLERIIHSLEQTELIQEKLGLIRIP